MSRRLIGAAVLVIVILTCMAVRPAHLQGQPAGADRPRVGENADDLVAAALQKVDAGDLEGARALLDRASRLKPDLPKLLLAEGLVLMNMGKQRGGYTADATLKLQAYTKTDEGRNDYRGFAALGAIYRESRMHRMAISPLEQARKLAPVEEGGRPVKAEITMDLAFSYLGLDRKKEALETAKEAESMAANDPKIQIGLARVALTVEDKAVSEAAIKKTIDLAKAKIQTMPFDKDAHDALQRAYDLLITGKKTAVRASPDDGATFYALAAVTRDSAEVDRRVTLLVAREYALQAVTKDPRKYDWQVLVARIEADLGGVQEAIKRLNDILKEAPENQEASKLLEALSTPPAAETAE